MMSKSKKFITCISLIGLLLSPKFLHGQDDSENICEYDENYGAEYPFYVVLDNYLNKCFLPNFYIDASHHFGDNPWYVDHYGNFIAAYIPNLQIDNLAPYADIRYSIGEFDVWAFGTTIGFRNHLSNCLGLFGAHFYFDYVESECLEVGQIGLALEYLTSNYQVRFNGFFPVNNKRKKCKIEVFDNYIGDFSVTTFAREDACGGFTAEVGSWCGFDSFFSTNMYWYTGIGPYYLHCHDSENYLGATLHGRLEWESILYSEIFVNYDRLYRWRVQGTIGIRFPLDLNFCKCAFNECFFFMFEPVKRSPFVPIKECCIYETNF